MRKTEQISFCSRDAVVHKAIKHFCSLDTNALKVVECSIENATVIVESSEPVDFYFLGNYVGLVMGHKQFR